MPPRFPVFRTGRGGRFTYHGPGQRVAYVMLDLSARGRDVRAFVHALEDWLIATLARLGVEGERHEGQIGVFVGEAKIASIGVRLRHWVSFHGVSLNVDPDLEHFSGIVPCGLTIAGDEPRRARGRYRHAARRCRASVRLRGDFRRGSAPIRADDLEAARRRAALLGHRHLGHARVRRPFGAKPQHLRDLVGWT